MVIFNDPLPCDEPVRRASELAFSAHAALRQPLNKWAQYGHHLGLGIGIASGYATLGIVGDDRQSDYTAIGNVVNIAARLCDRAGDGEILIDKRTCVEVEDSLQIEAVGSLDLTLPATQGALDRIDLIRVVAKNGFDYAALGLESILIVHSPLASGTEQFPVVNNHSPLFSDFVEAALEANGTVPWVRVDEIHPSCDKPPYVEKTDSGLGVQQVGFGQYPAHLLRR